MNPVAFSIFGLNVYWYGICYSVSILIIRHYFYKFCHLFSFPANLIDKGLLYAVCFGIVFARIFDVLVYDYHNFTLNPWLIFSIRDGGLSFHGAVIGLILCVFIFVRFHKNFFQKAVSEFSEKCSYSSQNYLNMQNEQNMHNEYNRQVHSKKRGLFFVRVLRVFDFIAIFSPICIFLVRIGNFINQELIGRQCAKAWYAVNIGNLGSMGNVGNMERNSDDSHSLFDLNGLESLENLESLNELSGLNELGQSAEYYVYPSQLIESFFEGFVLFLIMFTLMSRVFLKNVLLSRDLLSSRNVRNVDSAGNVGSKEKIGMLWMITHMLFDVNVFEKIALRLGWKSGVKLNRSLFHWMIYSYNSRFDCASDSSYGGEVKTDSEVKSEFNNGVSGEVMSGLSSRVFPGFYICVFLFFYGIFRFFCEFFRMPEIFVTCRSVSKSFFGRAIGSFFRNFLGDFCCDFFVEFCSDFLITIGQIFSLGMILMSILLWFVCKKIKM